MTIHAVTVVFKPDQSYEDVEELMALLKPLLLVEPKITTLTEAPGTTIKWEFTISINS